MGAAAARGEADSPNVNDKGVDDDPIFLLPGKPV